MGIPVCDGLIEVGNWKKEFDSRLDYWTCSDYIEFWKYSLQAIVCGEEIACLITLMSPPEAFPGSIELWPLYREKDCVFMQGKMISDPDIRKCFDPYNFSMYVNERRTVDRWGNRVYEKQISVAAIKAFLESGKLS